MEIISGVHQIKVPFPQGMPGYTNAYVVEGGAGNILVDTGWDTSEALSALTSGLKKDFLKFRDVRKIVITHLHPDHFGLASRLKQLCGATVAMHEIDAGLINARYINFGELLEEMGGELRRSGVPESELLELGKASLWMRQFVWPEAPEVSLRDGDKLSNGSFEFEILRTPGHSPGHICLYEPRKGLFFSGDHVLYQTTPHIGFHPQSGDNPLDDYIDSLREVKQLKVNFVFPGHGPVFNSLGLRVTEILNHHEQRKRTIMRAISDSLKTAYQIAEEIPWKVEIGGVAFRDLSPWDRRLAIMQLIAYLKSLMAEGKVGKVDRDGVSLYLAND